MRKAIRLLFSACCFFEKDYAKNPSPFIYPLESPVFIGVSGLKGTNPPFITFHSHRLSGSAFIPCIIQYGAVIKRENCHCLELKKAYRNEIWASKQAS